MGNGMDEAKAGTLGERGWSMTGTGTAVAVVLVVVDTREVWPIEGVRGLGCAMAFVVGFAAMVVDGLAFVFVVKLATESPEPLELTGP